MMKNKKGFAIQDIPNLGVLFVVIAVVLGIGVTILTQVQATQTTDGYAYNVTKAGISSVSTLSGWQSTWVIIIAAVVVLGMVGMLMMSRRR